jgi:hypothetical protein
MKENQTVDPSSQGYHQSQKLTPQPTLRLPEKILQKMRWSKAGKMTRELTSVLADTTTQLLLISGNFGKSRFFFHLLFLSSMITLI